MASDTETQTLDDDLSLMYYDEILRVHAGCGEDRLHAIADTRLSLSKLKLLHILARPHQRPPRLKRVGALLGVDDSAATRLVNELDQARYVDRIADEQDQRVKRVVITPRGRELLEQIDRAGVRGVERYVRALSARRRRLLRAYLDAE